MLLYVGLALALTATALYVRDGVRTARATSTLKLTLSCDAPRLYSRVPASEDRRTSVTMDTFPDLGSLSDQELKDLIQQLTEEELEISPTAAASCTARSTSCARSSSTACARSTRAART